MIEPRPWMSLHVRELFSRRVLAMRPQDAASLYIYLLCVLWEKGTIPDDPDAIEAMLPRHCWNEFRALWPQIRPMFTPTGDGELLHDRVERERTAATDRASFAKKGGETRAANARKRAQQGGSAPEFSSPAEQGGSANTERNGTGRHETGRDETAPDGDDEPHRDPPPAGPPSGGDSHEASPGAEPEGEAAPPESPPGPTPLERGQAANAQQIRNYQRKIDQRNLADVYVARYEAETGRKAELCWTSKRFLRGKDAQAAGILLDFEATPEQIAARLKALLADEFKSKGGVTLQKLATHWAALGDVVGRSEPSKPKATPRDIREISEGLARGVAGSYGAQCAAESAMKRFGLTLADVEVCPYEIQALASALEGDEAAQRRARARLASRGHTEDQLKAELARLVQQGLVA